jgi:hypothetical protein
MDLAASVRAELRSDTDIRGRAAAARRSAKREGRERAERILAKAQADTMAELASRSSDDDPAGAHMPRLREMHATIVGGIQQVREQTARLMGEQERDLLKSFRSRMEALQGEVSREKTRADTNVAEYVERVRVLELQLEAMREENDRLARENAALVGEAARFRSHLRAKDADHEVAVKQLVAQRRTIARLEGEAEAARGETLALRTEVEEVRTQVEADRLSRMDHQQQAKGVTATASGAPLATALPDEEVLRFADGVTLGTEPLRASGAAPRPGGTVVVSSPSPLLAPMDEARYRDVIIRLKRLLDTERRACKAARTALLNERAGRSEGEDWLRDAIADARDDMAATRAAVVAEATYIPPPSPAQLAAAARSPGRAGVGGSPAGSGATRGSPGVGVGVGAPQSPLSPGRGTSSTAASTHRGARETVLAALLQQEAVLSALPAAVFPRRGGGGGGGAEGDRDGERKGGGGKG